MCHVPRWIVLALAAALAACASPTTPDATARVVGDWIATDNARFRTILMTLHERADGSLRGEVIAWQRGCAGACRLDGLVIAGVRSGADVSLSVSFSQPVGADIAATLDDHGRMRGNLTRINTARINQRVTFRRP